MTPAEKLQKLVEVYLETHQRRAPRFIAMTPEDFRALKDAVCAHLIPELHYSPQFFHGIAIVISNTEKETVCLPR